MNDHKPTPAELLQILYAAAEGRTPAGINAAIAFHLKLIAEQTVAGLPAKLPEFVTVGSCTEAETQHLHYIEQDSPNNLKRVEAHTALVATGDTAKLYAEYAKTIAGLQELLKEMADAGYSVSAEMVNSPVPAGQAV